MEQGKQVIKCSRCGAEVTWKPVEQEGKLYCCEACARGSPCICRQIEAEKLLPMEDRSRRVPFNHSPSLGEAG